jgi:hypothetical protein
MDLMDEYVAYTRPAQPARRSRPSHRATEFGGEDKKQESSTVVLHSQTCGDLVFFWGKGGRGG